MSEWWKNVRLDGLEDELDLVHMTRGEVLEMHNRAKLIRERMLREEVLKRMIAQALNMPEGVRRGRLVWDVLPGLVPFEGHGLDTFDVKDAMRENLLSDENRQEFKSAAWWWRLRTVYDLTDPTAWVAEQKARKTVPTCR